MRDNRNEATKSDNFDTFDRSFVGKPGCMLILALIVVIVSLIYNYFN